jgi:hypothetical protein
MVIRRRHRIKNILIVLPLLVPFTMTLYAQGMDTQTNEISNTLYLHIGRTTLTATLVENSSTEALKRRLAQAPITINMQDYGNMEKVGSLGTTLPRNDERITTAACDLILYQGNSFVIYYAPNTYSLTRLGKINNITAQELKNILGSGNVTVTLSLSQD